MVGAEDTAPAHAAAVFGGVAAEVAKIARTLKPKMPLRVFTSDSVLIGEFGEERRNMVHIKDIPDVMKRWPVSLESMGRRVWSIMRLTGSPGPLRQRMGMGTRAGSICSAMLGSCKSVCKS